MSTSHSSIPQHRLASRRGPAHVLLQLSIIVLALLVPVQIWQASQELRTSGMDLQQDYIAAQRMLAGQDLYTPFSATEVSTLGVQETLKVGMRENAHPPFVVALFVPLTLLPYAVVALLWTLLCVAILSFVVWYLIDAFRLPLTGAWRWMVLLGLVSWYPVWLHLHQGQLTIPLLGLIVLAWKLLLARRDVGTGILLGLAALIKIFPAFLIGYLVLRRRWRAATSAVLTCAVILALHMAIAPDHWVRYFADAAPHNAAGWMRNSRNASLVSLGYKLFRGSDEVKPVIDIPSAEPATRAIAYVLMLGSYGWLMWKLRSREDMTGELGLSICAMVLLSPITWDHAFLFLLLPICYVWHQTHVNAIVGNLPRALVGVAMTLSLLPMELRYMQMKYAYLPERMPGWVGLLITGTIMLGCVYIATWLTLYRHVPAAHTES